MSAAAEPSSVPDSAVDERNAVVNERLSISGLQAINVIGDGNCFFRSLSVCLTGTENDHINLRASVIQHMASEATYMVGGSQSPSSVQVRSHLERMCCSGVWVGEDVIKASASFLGRAIHVFTGTGTSWPRIYQPEGGAAVASSLPVKIVFYEPGHYMALRRIPQTHYTTTGIASNEVNNAAVDSLFKPMPPSYISVMESQNFNSSSLNF